jgi:hypothetical protein
MAAISGIDFGKQLCDLWGLQNVRSIIIKIEMDSTVTIEVEQFMMEEQVKDLKSSLSKYELRPKISLSEYELHSR